MHRPVQRGRTRPCWDISSPERRVAASCCGLWLCPLRLLPARSHLRQPYCDGVFPGLLLAPSWTRSSARRDRGRLD